LLDLLLNLAVLALVGLVLLLALAARDLRDFDAAHVKKYGR
jgi:hypothetical protein